MCDGMSWNHLPVAGGLYDQDPEFLDKMILIFGVRAEHERKEEKKRKAEQDKASKRAQRGSRGRRR